jgi:TRAP transporter 4TM/12TM fusion protein
LSQNASPATDRLEEDERGRRSLRGFWFVFVFALGVITTLFHIITLTIYPLDPWVFRGISLGLFTILTFLLVPGWKGAKDNVHLADIALCIMALAAMVYLGLTYGAMYYRAGFAPTTMDWIFGFVAVVLTVEMTRRLLGLTLPIISVLLIFYALFGGNLPGILSHRGYEFNRLMSMLFSTEGLYGTAMHVASTYIIFFVAFAAFLRFSGVGDLFIELAMALAGAARGGPAKVAIFSSALFGTVQGGAIQNVLTTGSFTIPLMKRIGYEPHFAGAVEAIASTGGQIMPPIMGAVAFVLAEASGTPYRDVMLAALLPAICYFTSVYFMVDAEAVKNNLVGMPRSAIPNTWSVLHKGGHLLIPIVLLVYLIVSGRSVIYSALGSTIATIIVSWWRKETRIDWKKFLGGLYEGAIDSLEAVAACGIAGIVIGILVMTGLGQSLVMLIVDLAAGNLPLTLVFIMIVSIILGMGMPTVPAYILAASVGVPAVVKMGAPAFASHMFVMYFACLSSVTPPIALASYAAAGLAKADMNRTGWTALKLGIAAYIVPYMIIYSPALLWDGPWYVILRCLFTVFVGAYALAQGVNGYHFALLRLLYVAVGLMLISPDVLTDIIGFTVLGMLVLIQRFSKKGRNVTPAN